jgi:hypothetical protein
MTQQFDFTPAGLLSWQMGFTHTAAIESALIYQELGYSVVPVQEDSKLLYSSLCYPQCFERPAPPDELRAWWAAQPAARLGLACGVNGFSVLDFEQENERQRFMHLLTCLSMGYPAVPGGIRSEIHAIHKKVIQMPRVSTPSGGMHLYFWYCGDTDHYDDLAMWRGKSIINMLLAHRYVIAPPSAGYRWRAGQQVNDLPDLTPDELRRLRRICSMLGDGSEDGSAPYAVDYARMED